MRCPHCQDSIHAGFRAGTVGTDDGWQADIGNMQCPSCERLILRLTLRKVEVSGEVPHVSEREIIIYPRNPSARPLPPEVPPQYADDFNEAVAVFPFSPKASAALTRRCLQHLLRDQGGVKPSNLNNEIQEVLDGGRLPSHLADAIDAIRHIGNFAAHPTKSTESGSVVPVEPGEAEWSIETIEQLLDFYCVQPARLQAKRDALNAKLDAAGKPSLK